MNVRTMKVTIKDPTMSRVEFQVDEDATVSELQRLFTAVAPWKAPHGVLLADMKSSRLFDGAQRMRDLFDAACVEIELVALPDTVNAGGARCETTLP